MTDTAADSGSITGLRTAALVSFLFNTGLRISEALAVRPRDLQDRGDMQVVNVQRGKGGRQGISVRLGDRGQLAHWMAVRAGLGVSDDAPLFCTISRGDRQEPGSSLDRNDVRRCIKALAKRTGIHKRVDCHCMRHSHAVHLYAELGQPVAVVQDQLRHVNPRTTDTYLKRLGCSHTLDLLAGLST